MIIDIHCHILPAVDDGAKNERVTERMMKIADEEGIDIIVATPHFACGRDKEDTEEIKKKYAMVQEWMKEEYPEKELFLGNEIYYSERVIQALEEGIALTMNDTRYVLVEFPVYSEVSYIRKAVQRLVYAGYVPIIAHIERYTNVKREHIEELVDIGAYIQVNASSITGKHGLRRQIFLLGLLRRHLIHFIGTDAHDVKERRPEIKRCWLYLKKVIGETETDRILCRNPIQMLRGEEIDG